MGHSGGGASFGATTAGLSARTVVGRLRRGVLCPSARALLRCFATSSPSARALLRRSPSLPEQCPSLREGPPHGAPRGGGKVVRSVFSLSMCVCVCVAACRHMTWRLPSRARPHGVGTVRAVADGRRPRNAYHGRGELGEVSSCCTRGVDSPGPSAANLVLQPDFSGPNHTSRPSRRPRPWRADSGSAHRIVDCTDFRRTLRPEGRSGLGRQFRRTSATENCVTRT